MGGRAESTTLPCRAPQRKGIWWGRSIAGVLLDGLQTLWRLNNQPRRHKPKPRSGIRTRPEPFEPDMERTKQWLQADSQYNEKISKTAVRAEPTALRRATHAHPTETPTQLTAAEERAGDGRCDSNPKPRDAREEKQREARRTRRK